MEQDIKEQMEEQGRTLTKEGNTAEHDQREGEGTAEGEVKPEEDKSTENKAGDQTEEVKAGEGKPEETKAEETKPEETKAEEAKPEETKIEEKTEASKIGAEKPENEDKEAAKSEGSKEAESKSEEEKPEEKKKSRTGRKILFSLLGAGISALIAVYICAANYYQSHFFPNTEIDGIDCSNLDEIAVETRILLQNQNYILEITGRDEQGTQKPIGTLRTEDIDYTFVDVDSAVRSLLEEQNNWLWIARFFDSTHYSYDLVLGVTFDEEKMTQALQQMDACQKKNMVMPENAYISECGDDVKGYEIVPETLGTQLDMNAVSMAVSAAIYANADRVDLEEQGCYVSAAVTKEDTALLNNLETVDRWLGARITYDWNGNKVEVGLDEIWEWVSFQNGKPHLDEEAIAEFVAQQAKTYDTYGKRRNFITTLGTELSLPGGAYGWKTDREAETAELIQCIEDGMSGEREPVYSSKGAAKGSNDIGSSYVEADLTNQHLYLYQNGNLVLETDFVSGNMSNGNVTPPGVFGITYKTRNAVLRGADYETPVSYWMPFNGNVGMHDATWRGVFGGDIYLTSGSHGCINLPLDKAAAIYDYMSEGFPVICYYY